MKDPRNRLLRQLVSRLTPVGLPIFSTVDLNSANPYIYIGDIQLSEVDNKTTWMQSGTFTVELFTGTSAWTGSLLEPISWIFDIKNALQTIKTDVLELDPTHQMIYMKLQNDSGLQNYSSSQKMYIGSLIYEFQIIELVYYEERVENDGGTIESITCIPVEYR